MRTEIPIGEPGQWLLIAQAKKAARVRWGRCTAYRVGWILGEAGIEVMPSPYAGQCAKWNFSLGLVDGLRQRTNNVTRRPPLEPTLKAK